MLLFWQKLSNIFSKMFKNYVSMFNYALSYSLLIIILFLFILIAQDIFHVKSHETNETLSENMIQNNDSIIERIRTSEYSVDKVTMNENLKSKTKRTSKHFEYLDYPWPTERTTEVPTTLTFIPSPSCGNNKFCIFISIIESNYDTSNEKK
jgi:hypothetical protein